MEMKAEYLAIFSEEAAEQVREWEECLLALEKSPGDREALNGMFRAIHTLKGSAGFIGFSALQKLEHDLESSLSDVRDGARPLDGTLSEVLFCGLDLSRKMIEAFAEGRTPDVDVEGLRARLAAPSAPETGPAGNITPTGSAAAAGPAPAAAAAGHDTPTSLLKVTIQGQNREAYLRSCLVKARLDRLGKVLSLEPTPESLRDSSEPFVYTVRIACAQDAAALASQISIDQVSVAPAPEPLHPEETETAVARDAHQQFSRGSHSDEVVRVSVQKLDTLLNLVGELVIHNSGFVATAHLLREEYGKARPVYELESRTEALSAITRELQDGIMKARMLPIASVFNRFRRVVRDLSRSSGKSVALEVFGEETEIDKKVIDRIGEPLVHLVRNAVDHGLESSAERTSTGKNATGTVRLGAFQDGDHICIEISDDGRGLDREAVLRKALEKGLISAEEAPRASEEQILGFIFLPGFSTARSVTDISGRGVGMDAVRKAVEEMSGSLRVRSTPRVGTTVTISLPLTMAIITAVLVEVTGSTYAIPLSAVREILKASQSSLRTVGGRSVIRLRDEVLALVNLVHALQGRSGSTGAPPRPGSPVVVVDFEGRRIGIEVEKILGTREVVIKSLSRHYREVDGLIGASILGNGTIALIVDVEALISWNSNAAGDREAGAHVEAAATPAARAPSAPRPSARADGPPGPVVPADDGTPSAATDAQQAAPPAPAVDELARLVAGARGRLLEDVNNQGAIQASQSLTQLAGNEIRVSFPESRLVELKDVANALGGEETPVAGIYIAVGGQVTGGMLLVIPEASLLLLDDMLHGRPRGTTAKASDIDLSGLSEVGNILASCFVNAMADASRLAIVPEVPEVCIDMCLPVVDGVLARFNQPGTRLLLTEAVIFGGEMNSVVCHQALFLDPDSLRSLLDAMAAEAATQAAR